MFPRFDIPSNYCEAWNMLLKKHFMLNNRPFRRSEIDHWEKICIRTEELVASAFMSSKNEDGSQKFSVNYIYSHQAREHWPRQSLWLGPAPLQSTQEWEHEHQTMKSLADDASTRYLYQSVMTLVCNACSAYLFSF